MIQNIEPLYKHDYIDVYLKNYKNASAKFAFYADNDTVSELNILCQCSNLLLQESLLTRQVRLALSKDNIIYDLIENTLQRILAAGIPQHSAEYHKWVLYRRNAADEIDEPKPFVLDDVFFAIALWLITLEASIVVFFGEVLWVRGRKCGREFLGLILFMVLLNRRLTGAQ
jgi:hypothetical protein